MKDDLDDRLQRAASEYHVPPPTPREAMWKAIQADRRTGGQAERTGGYRRTAVPPYRRFLPWSAGIAALLALGFGLGRMTQKDPGPASIPSSAGSRINQTAYQVVTTEHLSQAEAFLTLFRASVGRRSTEPLGSATARQLLATNRLLLDSPAAADARVRLLLEDLERVLAEIAQLSPEPRKGELQLITEGLERDGVLARLRTAVPAGPGITQGAL